MQLNELRLVSETEFNQWRASWDGITKPPEEMLNYVARVIMPATTNRMQETVKRARESLNEN